MQGDPEPRLSKFHQLDEETIRHIASFIEFYDVTLIFKQSCRNLCSLKRLPLCMEYLPVAINANEGVEFQNCTNWHCIKPLNQGLEDNAYVICGLSLTLSTFDSCGNSLETMLTNLGKWSELDGLLQCSKLNLSLNCRKLTSIDDLERYHSLSELAIGCPALISIAGLGRCHSLRVLVISTCHLLTSIDGLG